MIQVEYDVHLSVRDSAGRVASLTDIAPLLDGIAATGSIARAAAARGLSYRHAWGLLRAFEACVGAALIETVRGKGTALSALGRAVADARRLADERLDGALRTCVADIASELNRRVARHAGALCIHASHGYAVAALASAWAEAGAPLDLKYRESIDAVKALADCAAERALAHHHGTFQLTDEAIDAPALALAEALDAANLPRERFLVLKPGQVLEI